MKIIEASDEAETGIDVAPLIDILCTLIIFFLMTTTFEEEEKSPEIQLPRHGGSSLAAKMRPFTINVTETGDFKVNNEVYDLDRLESELKYLKQDDPDKKVVIRGDAMARHGQTTAALAAATRAGFTSANIAWDTSTAQR